MSEARKLAPLVDGAASDRIAFLDAAVERMNGLVAASIRRAIRAGTKHLGEHLTAAGEDASPYVSLDDLAAIGAEWKVAVASDIVPAIGKVWEKGAEWVMDDLALDGARLNMSIPAAEKYLMAARNQLNGVGTAVWQDVRSSLVDGMGEGESIEELAARVREVAGASTVDARRIARTNVIGSTNAGALAQVQASTANPRKQWLATGGPRTRPSHAEADGQVVGIDETFTVGDSDLQYPGDPAGSYAEVENCRCTLTWVFD